MRPVASTRDLVYAWINEQIDNGVDFTDKEARIASRKKFLNAHPDQKPPSVEAAWSKVLTRVAKERKIAITQVKQPRRAPKEYNTGELDPQGSPEPVEVDAGSISIKPGARESQDRQGRQEQRQAGGQGQEGQRRDPYENWERKTYTARAIGAFFNGLYTGIRAVIPEAEPLTDAEIETLGELWVDHFNIILAERPKLSIVMALGGTLGLLAGKIIEARRKQKKREATEQTINETRDKAKRSAEAQQAKSTKAEGWPDPEATNKPEQEAAPADDEVERGAESFPRRTAGNDNRRAKEADE